MLVLKRNINETIKVGDNITIMVTDVGNGWAKIGIDAPKQIPVIRPEAKNKTPSKEMRSERQTKD